MAEIYGLYSGQDGTVRYVGQTGGDCAHRFEQHKRDAEGLWAQPRLCKWFHAEWRRGYPVDCVLLESCNYDERHQLETKWIHRFPYRHLLNERKLNRWEHATKPPVIPEIVAYRRRYLFNAGGFRGICYDHHWDCYRVLIYTGSGVEWLFGDQCDEMMPGWGGNMWFPDRTAALMARDRAQAVRSVIWLPDKEEAYA